MVRATAGWRRGLGEGEGEVQHVVRGHAGVVGLDSEGFRADALQPRQHLPAEGILCCPACCQVPEGVPRNDALAAVASGVNMHAPLTGQARGMLAPFDAEMIAAKAGVSVTVGGTVAVKKPAPPMQVGV